MTPLEALQAARLAHQARAEQAARVDAAHRLCVSSGHRGSDSHCFRCPKCVRAVDDAAADLRLFEDTQ